MLFCFNRRERDAIFLNAVLSPLAEVAGFTSYFLKIHIHYSATLFCRWHHPVLVKLVNMFFYLSSSLHLHLPAPSSPHRFKIQCSSQHVIIIIPPQHMTIAFLLHSLLLAHLVFFKRSMSICSSVVFLSATFRPLSS